MEDLTLFCFRSNEWVENEKIFEVLVGSDTDFIFKLVVHREMKDFGVRVNASFLSSLAVVDSLDSVFSFTDSEHVFDYLKKKQEKYLILRVNPEDTGDYKVSFEFSYKVK